MLSGVGALARQDFQGPLRAAEVFAVVVVSVLDVELAVLVTVFVADVLATVVELYVLPPQPASTAMTAAARAKPVASKVLVARLAKVPSDDEPGDGIFAVIGIDITLIRYPSWCQALCADAVAPTFRADT
jgi:hypothetical protein